jgi:hypothetical protein
MKNITLYNVPILLLLLTLFLLSIATSAASESNKPTAKQSVFIGNWTVTKVDFPDNYFSEIKYPVSFQITTEDSEKKHEKDSQANVEIKGSYKDQFDHQCDFSLAQLINNGNELLLLTCGTTKHTESSAPLHKVKFINGQLVGAVITKTQRFVWYAEPTKPEQASK